MSNDGRLFNTERSFIGWIVAIAVASEVPRTRQHVPTWAESFHRKRDLDRGSPQNDAQLAIMFLQPIGVSTRDYSARLSAFIQKYADAVTRSVRDISVNLIVHRDVVQVWR